MSQRPKIQQQDRPTGIPAGEALRQIRKRAGLRQADLGEIFTIDQSQISSLENGKRLLRLDTFASCANVCGYRLALIPEEPDQELVFIEAQTSRRRRSAKEDRK